MYHHTSQAGDWQALPLTNAMYQGSGRATPCSQSQIGQDRHLRKQEAAQVDIALALSVTVCSGPVVTAVNGTLVARSVTMPFAHRGAVGSALTGG
jgi:hypothetical protein